MTSANTSETCAFPDCGRPVRAKAGDGGGKPPIYCDLTNPSTGKYAHTSLTAGREEARLEKLAAAEQPATALAPVAPASQARDRAQGLLEQFRVEVGRMTGTLQSAVTAMTEAGSPDNVSNELTSARREVERVRLETAQQISDAEQARDQALAAGETLRTQVSEAKTARNEAITELETAETTMSELRQELERVAADHAAELERLRGEHVAELRRVRADTEQQIAAARSDATEQIATARSEAAGQVQAAEQARDQALTEATTARQAATDATHRADEARDELRQARTEHRTELATVRSEHRDELAAAEQARAQAATEHRDELTALRQEHRDELAAERQRADAALETVRAEHRREVEALQQALTALRGQRDEGAAPEESADQRKRR